MQVSVKDIKGNETGRIVNLPQEIFGVEPNDHAIYLTVKQYLANQRQGTHKSKEKWEVAYSTKKVVRQKGSGGARHGSIKSGTYVGGGRIFGPKPRDYSFKINKKVKSLARASALSYKVKGNALTIVEDFSFAAPKTKEFLSVLSNLSLNGKKTLFVVGDNSENVYLSARNIPGASVVKVDSLNTYQILHADNLVFCEGTLGKLNEFYA
jgi:large subunit ribosomal protein L4